MLQFGMIEQIQAAGQSGMTGKSTKHGKNSLFAKLLAMLEKNAELSGKGKGLQLNAGKSGKAKGLAGLTEKSDPFTVAKSKHLLALAAKGKTEAKDKAGDDAVASLLAAHVIVDPKSYVKELDKAGKTSVLIAGQLGEKAADPSGGLLGKNAVENGLMGKGDVLSQGADKTDVLLNKMAQAGAGKETDALAGQQKGQIEKGALAQQPAQQGIAAASASSASIGSTSAQLDVDNVQASLATASKNALASEQEIKAVQMAKAGQVDAAAATTQANKTELDVAARAVLDGQKAGAALQGKHSLGEKKIDKKIPISSGYFILDTKTNQLYLGNKRGMLKILELVENKEFFDLCSQKMGCNKAETMKKYLNKVNSSF